MVATVSGGLSDELTSAERTFVLKQRLINAIFAVAINFQRVAWNQSYLDLCGGDTARMAMDYGRTRSISGVISCFANPLCVSTPAWPDLS